MLLRLRGLIFSVLVPGVVALYVPQTMRNGAACADYRHHVPRWFGWPSR